MIKYHLSVGCLASLIAAISVQTTAYGIGLATDVDTVNGGTITITNNTILNSWLFNNKTGVTWTDFHLSFRDSSSNQAILVNVAGDLKSGYDIIFGGGTADIRPGNSFDVVLDPKQWVFSSGDTIVQYAPSYDLASVPEPLTILGSVAALGFGAYAERKRKSSNSSEEDNTKDS